MTMKRLIAAIFLFLISSTLFAYDCSSTYAPSWCSNISHTWNEGSIDTYVPVWIWHNRATYDSVKIAHYNELPWGVGIGKHYYDAEGDLHRLFAMGFLDSHSKVEPLAGYSFEKIFRPAADWKLGIGYTAFVTARADNDHYMPIPAILPLWSVHYGRFSVEQTYVPGMGRNNGNVLFTWLRFEF
jgi:palmitoyl transferase